MLVEDIKVSFQQCYEKFINTSLEERNYNIPIYYNISNNEWEIVNKVVHDFIISTERYMGKRKHVQNKG